MGHVYRFKTRPYKHQVRAVRFALRRFKAGVPGVAFLMEPRTGKTKTTIDTFSCLHHMYGVRKVFIVAPNRVLGTWVREISIHCPLTVQVIIWDRAAREVALPKSMGPYDMQIVVVNFEAFSHNRRTATGRSVSRVKGRFGHKRAIQRWIGSDPAVGVVDESHKIKNPSGKAANMIVSMRDFFRWRLILTGTPVTKAKRAFDIYMQWQWLGTGQFDAWGATVEDFKNHTGQWTTRNGFPQWLRARNNGMADLRRGIHTDGIVVTRDQCFDLPPRETRVISVPLGTKAARHYDEMATDMVTRLNNGQVAEASIPLVVTLRLLQITSGFVGIPHVVPDGRGGERLVTMAHRISTEKLTALRDLLTEETLEREEKIVIAARFNPDLNAIVRLSEQLHLPVFQVRGKISRAESDQAINDFRIHDGPAAMVIQPAAASLGIDLSTAPQVVWYSLTPSWVDFTQANDRIALSRVSTTFTYLLAEGTVDHLVYETLLDDGNVARAIMEKPERILRTVR